MSTQTMDTRSTRLTWNQALEAGGVLVRNDVSISIEVQATEEEES